MSGVLGQEVRSTIKASTHPTVRDLEWAAGFLEGEGSFTRSGVVQRGKRYHGTEFVNGTQKDPETLYRLQQLFGGAVRKHGSRDVHHWVITGPRARGVMFTLYPLLSARRKEQIRRALRKEG